MRIFLCSTYVLQYSTPYFLESGDKIRYFYEKEALDDKGDLKVDIGQALNKVGHALHWLHPQFKEVSFSRKVQDLCRAIHLDDPVIVQSMYIYKNPKIGGEGKYYKRHRPNYKNLSN